MELAQEPADASQNACGQFYRRAIKGKEEKGIETEEEVGEIARALQEVDDIVRAQLASLQTDRPTQEKDRNPGQVASSSNTAAPDRVVAGPAGHGPRSEPQVPEQQATELDCDSESVRTEQPPPTDIPSPDPDLTPGRGSYASGRSICS